MYICIHITGKTWCFILFSADLCVAFHLFILLINSNTFCINNTLYPKHNYFHEYSYVFSIFANIWLLITVLNSSVAVTGVYRLQLLLALMGTQHPGAHANEGDALEATKVGTAHIFFTAIRVL